MKKGNLKILWAILIGIIYFSYAVAAENKAWPKKMIVGVSVADVRHKPQKPQKLSYQEMDWDQTTQLLFGEKIIAFEEKDGWLRIKVLDQKISVNGEWYELSGWVDASKVIGVREHPSYNLVVKVPWTYIYSLEENKKKQEKRAILSLSIGTKLLGRKYGDEWWEVVLPGGKTGIISNANVRRCSRRGASNKELIRTRIIKTAELFLGGPYLWGGRSFYNSKMQGQWTSVDCSSFVELCHKVHGIDVPRNSKSQYLASKKLEQVQKPGDLIFIAGHNDPETIKHVMFYGGGDRLVEAKGNLDGKLIRKVIKSVGKIRLGRSVSELKTGDKISEGVIFVGTFLG